LDFQEKFWTVGSCFSSFTLSICLSSVEASAQSNQASPLGINLTTVSYATPEHPFLNIFKTGGGWTPRNSNYVNAGGQPTGENALLYSSFLDANGYPTTLTGGPAHNFTRVSTLVLSSAGPYPTGNYVLQYDGTGSFEFDFDATNSSIISSAQGRIVINVPSAVNGIMIVLLTTDPNNTGDYVRNIRFVYSPDSTASVGGTREALLNGGEIFNPDFISRVAPFKTLRFMDWMQTNGSTQSAWANRPPANWVFWDDSYFGGGVPAEVMMALCNEISADCWFNMPALATDDYVTQFATLAHSQLNSGLKVYTEFSNEIWNGNCNGGDGNLQAIYNLGMTAFPSAANNCFSPGFDYGILRAVQTGAIWKNVWGADSSRVIRVLSGQIGYTARNQYILGFTAGQDGGNAASFSGTAASNVDVFSTAPYFSNVFYAVPDTLTLDQLFTEMMSGGVVAGGYPGGMIKETLDLATSDQSLARSYGLAYVAYEGGQGFVDYSGSDTALQTLFTSANRDPRMGTAYTTLLNGWKSLGGTMFNQYNMAFVYSRYGYWGALESITQTSTPKYNALTSFISTTPCWWTGCSGSGTTTPPPPTPTTTPPTIPTGLNGSASSASQVGLAWNASTDTANTVAGYNVFRNGQKVGSASKTSYQDSGLLSGTAYQYSVSAYDASGNTSAQSPAITVATPAQPPSPPSVAISSPVNGVTIKNNGAINIASSAASSSSTIVSIAITADGSQLLTCANTTTCSASWVGKNISKGTHTIGATATDAHGLTASTTITIVDLK
jgi:chitodextrinase